MAFRQGENGGFNIAYGGRYKHDLNLDSFRFFRDFWYCLKKFKNSIRLKLGHDFIQDLTGELDRFNLHRTLDPAPADEVLNHALTNFKNNFPRQNDIKFARTWAGYIDATPDMLPVIDRIDQPQGVVLATGFSGHGFGLGPMAGWVAAQLAVEETVSYDLTAFRYARFREGKILSPGDVL